MWPESYTGEVYQAQSGQWSWLVAESGEEVQGGAGYPDEDEARADMLEALAEWRGRLYG